MITLGAMVIKKKWYDDKQGDKREEVKYGSR